MSTTTQVHDLELLEELVLGSARGGKKQAAPLAVSVVRPLTAEDVPLLRAPPPVASKAKTPLQMRHSHHQLARLIALGKPQEEISLITGYSVSYISVLKGGEDFQNLVRYYADQKEMVFVEVMERMKVMGLNTLEEIQRRFEEAPEQFTTSQLMELTELMILKPAKITAEAQAKGSTGAGAPPVQVNVQFISPPQAAPAAELLDVTPRVAGALR